MLPLAGYSPALPRSRAAGVPEDPVTGSAHCCPGLYWQARPGRDAFVAWQASSRAERRGDVAGDRVAPWGRAVPSRRIPRGIILVPGRVIPPVTLIRIRKTSGVSPVFRLQPPDKEFYSKNAYHLYIIRRMYPRSFFDSLIRVGPNDTALL
ncbi:MAG TPA: PhzF family phenazine biosynthesis protein [Methanoculleus sp.]|nr:PhzF family phenazine biosynthesis protein [Methanoculleus sp.]